MKEWQYFSMRRRQLISTIFTCGVGSLAGCITTRQQKGDGTNSTSTQNQKRRSTENDEGNAEPTTYETTTTSTEADIALRFGEWFEYPAYDSGIKINSIEYKDQLRGTGTDTMTGDRIQFRQPANGVWAIFTYSYKPLSDAALFPAKVYWSAKFSNEMIGLTGSSMLPVEKRPIMVYDNSQEMWIEENILMEKKYETPKNDDYNVGDVVDSWLGFDVPVKFEGENEVKVGHKYSSDDGWRVVWVR